MNLMDTLMDEFHEEQKFKELNEREVAAWLEVPPTSENVFSYICILKRIIMPAFLPTF